MPANLPVAFGALLVGGLLLEKGLAATKDAFASTPAAGATSTSSSSTSVNVQTINTALGPTTNPVPGATGTRLDQGFDGTTKTFLAPFEGTVVYSSSHDSGWDGGGYIAIASKLDPSKVFFAAEGLVPTKGVGDTVKPGDVIATPAVNPYNGIVGNYEIGWANPAAPGQPLAAVISNAKSSVMSFYQWILSLGGPVSTDTHGAGFP